MIQPVDGEVPEVADNEVVSRYVTQKDEFRNSDQCVKRTLFMPHPKDGAVSVMRHRQATLDEIWAVGVRVASRKHRTLYGRCELRVSDCRNLLLAVVRDPLRDPEDSSNDNPNHANIIGWPPAKEDQVLIAQKLAAFASKMFERPA
jgi:hypothetical protein